MTIVAPTFPDRLTGLPPRRQRRAPQAGFTLLELVVVLVILGLGAGLVGFVRAPRAAEASVPEVVAQARRLAVDRAQSLVFEATAERWWLRTVQGDTLRSGLWPTQSGAAVDPWRTDAPGDAVIIDPLGNCRPDTSTPRRAGVVLDALQCRWVKAGMNDGALP